MPNKSVEERNIFSLYRDIMDVQLIAILTIFGLLFVLEQYEKHANNNKEKFTVAQNPGYTNWSPNLETGFFPVNYSVNFGNTKGFGNFGTFGSYPPNPLCQSCDLESNAVSPPFQNANDVGGQAGDQFGRVGRSCRSISGKNYGDLNRPFLVEARANGRPRQCRRLI